MSVLKLENYNFLVSSTTLFLYIFYLTNTIKCDNYKKKSEDNINLTNILR